MALLPLKPSRLPAPPLPTLAALPFVPAPETLSAAAGNVAHKVLYGGLADLRPMPRTLIDDGMLREVYRYRPLPGVEQHGDPVLLVTPLAAPSSCYDLRRGCSLVEHLLRTGRPTYVVEYGEVSFRNRTLGIEHWVSEVVPTAIRAVREDSGRPVHVVAWSLGGTFSLLAAAVDQELPIASLAILGTPVDVAQVPLIAPLRPLVDLTNGRVIGSLVQVLGGAPKPLVRWAFQLSSFDKLVTKPIAQATHLADADFLAQLEAVDRFTHDIIAYPGRTFGQLYHRFLHRNELVHGTFDLDGVRVDLRDIAQPVLVLAGATDGIAPVNSVRPLVDMLQGADRVDFAVVPGGHLGMLTGRAARTTTWPRLDEWLAAYDGADGADTAPPASEATPSESTASESTASESTASESTADPAPHGVIGANPERRYRSEGSRALRRR